nr:hypothetical protein Csa_4G055435 [Ipomoea trifida]
MRLSFTWLCNLGGASMETTSFGAGSCSRAARTSGMQGRALGSIWRHFNARAAAAWAPFFGYCPPNLESMILITFRLSLRNGNAQSTKVSCAAPPAFSSPIALLPDKSSNKTTPKLYTSFFVVNHNHPSPRFAGRQSLLVYPSFENKAKSSLTKQTIRTEVPSGSFEVVEGKRLEVGGDREIMIGSCSSTG